MKDRFYYETKKLKGVKIYKNIDIREDITFKISTIFSYKIEVYSFIAVKRIFELLKKYKKEYFVIGKGSNVLFSKVYYDCVLIKFAPFKSKYLNIVTSGESLNYINDSYLKLGISSLDFLCGVPCSIGGAIYMNAGAFDESISKIIEFVYGYDIDNNRYKVFNNNECLFEYRDSYFKHHNIIILGAKIKINYMDKKDLELQHNNRLMTRRKKMPLEYPNIGSIFKNPQGHYAGKLIADLGLKGLRIGGSMISYKHANVIVNYNECKGIEVLKLIEIIEEEVYIKYKINLEREIIVFK